MIAAEPALAERLVARLGMSAAVGNLVAEIRESATAGRPILTTGCGTSEHAAMAIAELLTEALEPRPGHEVRSIQALESLRRPLAQGLLIGVSHEGGTHATNEALRSAGEAGARTALITVTDRSPAAEIADLVVATEEQDRSWCHTVGYLSPLLVGVVLASRLSETRIDGRAIRALLDVSEDARAAAAIAAGLTGTDRIVVIGSGVDRITAHELALKIAEGARLPAQAMDAETLLHGHLAAASRWTGLILVQVADQADERVRARTLRALQAARTLSIPTAALLSETAATSIASELTPSGRQVLPRTGRVPPLAGALLGSAIALQLTAERLARARSVNPDTLGREDPAQATAHS